jgi:hypothetical protein
MVVVLRAIVRLAAIGSGPERIGELVSPFFPREVTLI